MQEKFYSGARVSQKVGETLPVYSRPGADQNSGGTFHSRSCPGAEQNAGENFVVCAGVSRKKQEGCQNTISSSNHLLVAAIDFGTAYSGYAYSFIQKPRDIIANTEWESGTERLCSMKTPTVILFDENQKFHSFGYEAESKYATLSEDEDGSGEYKKWFFFKHFKMSLYQEFKRDLGDTEDLGPGKVKRISRNMRIWSENGNRMKALDVFSAAVGFMKEHLMDSLKKANKGLFKTEDVKWVLTVPAIWHAQAKQFMREAATMAGVPGGHLILALEPEAAAMFCKTINVARQESDDGSCMEGFTPGQKFVVVDCGGGTVDITSYKVTDNCNGNGDSILVELCAPSGGPWGGTYVDKAFLEFLKDLVGEKALSDFEDEYSFNFLELKRAFEVKKRNYNDRENTQITNGVGSLLHLCRENNNSSLEGMISVSKYKGDVSIYKDRLRISPDTMASFFKGCIDNIIHHIKTLLDSNKLKDVDCVMMVGGFSECGLLRSQIKKSFAGEVTEKFIIPREGSLAVLKGAVLFGHRPDVIDARISPFTYGVCASVPFDERKHPPEHRHVVDGEVRCTDVFHVMVTKGETLHMGISSYETSFNPSSHGATEEEIEIYYTEEIDPKFTKSENCKKLGVVKLKRQFTYEEILVKIFFGFTEIKVTVKESKADYETCEVFDCL